MIKDLTRRKWVGLEKPNGDWHTGFTPSEGCATQLGLRPANVHHFRTMTLTLRRIDRDGRVLLENAKGTLFETCSEATDVWLKAFRKLKTYELEFVCWIEKRNTKFKLNIREISDD